MPVPVQAHFPVLDASSGADATETRARSVAGDEDTAAKTNPLGFRHLQTDSTGTLINDSVRGEDAWSQYSDFLLYTNAPNLHQFPSGKGDLTSNDGYGIYDRP